MTVCHVCGIPADAGFFDESGIVGAPDPGGERVLARYELHRNYCGLLLYFAQYYSPFASDPREAVTSPFRWEIRINGVSRDPYPPFERIINPWGLHGFPVNVRLDQGALVEFAIRNTKPLAGVATKARTRKGPLVGGRLIGRYWYDTSFGGAPNPL